MILGQHLLTDKMRFVVPGLPVFDAGIFHQVEKVLMENRRICLTIQKKRTFRLQYSDDRSSSSLFGKKWIPTSAVEVGNRKD